VGAALDEVVRSRGRRKEIERVQIETAEPIVVPTAPSLPPGPAQQFGQALRDHRYARRLTQAELAESAGLNERAIGDLERGLKAPQRATVHLLVEALGLTPEEAEPFQLAARGHIAILEPVDAAENSAHHNLPATRTTFVGRSEDLARLQRLLAPHDVDDALDVRLVTLIGAGGCGKTRLAIELARRVLVAFPDGVWFVDLSSLADASLVPMLVLTTIGGRESSDQTPLEALLRRVRGKRMLLVLDNCEHLVQACAELVEAVLGETSRVSVLATSREALRVAGESALRVPSLAFPDPAHVVKADQLLQYAAAKLLVDRILQLEPEFRLDASNAAAVAQVCSRLDGIPLALELAAARTVAMSVQDVAVRLDDCFHLLTGGRRTAFERQRTLRATIDWSHDLLTQTERVLFRRLAVFSGGWTLEAAEAVCADERLPSDEILEVLIRLIDQVFAPAPPRSMLAQRRFRQREPRARWRFARRDPDRSQHPTRECWTSRQPGQRPARRGARRRAPPARRSRAYARPTTSPSAAHWMKPLSSCSCGYSHAGVHELFE
jgi:predicted ATPase/DNA-binding XRE family transcriptional regulator